MSVCMGRVGGTLGAARGPRRAGPHKGTQAGEGVSHAGSASALLQAGAGGHTGAVEVEQVLEAEGTPGVVEAVWVGKADVAPCGD